MSQAEIPVREAVYSRLSNDSQLQNLLGGSGNIHNAYAPAGETYPYVTVGEGSSEHIDVKDQRRERVEIEIHCYAEQNTEKGVLEIKDRIHELIHRAESNLNVPGWELERSEALESRVIGNQGASDNLGIQGVDRYVFEVHQ